MLLYESASLSREPKIFLSLSMLRSRSMATR